MSIGNRAGKSKTFAIIDRGVIETRASRFLQREAGYWNWTSRAVASRVPFHAEPMRMTVEKPYRPNVGIALFNTAGFVLIGRRFQDDGPEIILPFLEWQMPQGGIDEGETPVEAGFRELKEEIGTDKAALLRELPEWLTYDLPPHLLGVALHGRFRGQRQKWLAMRFTGEDTDINIATADPEFAHWKWLAVEALPRLIVPFKRDTYTKVIAAFRDLAFPV